MKKIFLILGGLVLILTAMLTGISCSQPTATPPVTPAPGQSTPAPPAPAFTQEQSQSIAREFVVKEPTFAFDGMVYTLKLANVVTLKNPDSWQFTYQFQSRHAGYGDRTGQILAQVITPHQAAVTVINGKVTEAIMDGRWDMLKQ